MFNSYKVNQNNNNRNGNNFPLNDIMALVY